MKINSKILLSVLVSICLLVSLIISACAPASTPTSTTAPIPTATKPAGPKTGGVLRLSYVTDANRMGFPATITFFQDIIMSKTCVEMLLRVGPDGSTVPWLVESWTQDPNAKTITLKLRKGVKFHDGTDFNAEAVKWNLDTFSARGRSEIMGVKSTEIVDDYTLRLNLSQWDSTVLMGLAWAAGPIISPTAWKNAPNAKTDKERDTWAEANPVGTGPFQLVNWTRSTKQVYKKFPNYWGKGQPYLDGVEWVIIADPMVQSASFQAKEIDIVFGLSPSTGKQLKEQGHKLTVLETNMGVQFKGTMAQSAKPGSPFKDIRLRQAVGHAVDSQALINGVFYGYATALNQYSAPTNAFTNPDVKGYPYDLAKAQKLVTEAGYSASNPLKTVINTINRPDDVAVATAIQAMLAKAYIQASVNSVESAPLQTVQREGNWEGLMCGTFRTDPEPALQFLRIIASTGVQYTKGIIHPEEMEALYPKLMSAPTDDTRKKITFELQKFCFDTHCIFSPHFLINGLAIKQPYAKDDNIMTVKFDQWTPETAWLDK